MCKSQERWKDLEDFPAYKVSTKGNIYSKHTNKILIPSLGGGSGKSYKALLLRNSEGQLKNARIHRLVALAFIDNPDNKLCVNHKDSDTLNNCKCNLEWVTQKENSHHSISAGRRGGSAIPGELNRFAKLSNNQTASILHCYGSVKADILAQLYGVSKSNIYKIWKRTSWRHI